MRSEVTEISVKVFWKYNQFESAFVRTHQNMLWNSKCPDKSNVFRLGEKIEDEFDDILKDMHFKY